MNIVSTIYGYNSNYLPKKVNTHKIDVVTPSAMCVVFNPLAFENPKNISVPLQATSAKASLNKRSTVIIYSFILSFYYSNILSVGFNEVNIF